MKTARIIFASAAIAIASISVFANTTATQFYRKATTGTPSPLLPACDVSISITGCDTSSGLQCTVPSGETFYIVSKRIDGGDCVLAKKPA